MNFDFKKPLKYRYFFLIAILCIWGVVLSFASFFRPLGDGIVYILIILPPFVAYLLYKSSAKRYRDQFENGILGDIVFVKADGIEMWYDKSDNVVTVKQSGEPELRFCRSKLSIVTALASHTEYRSVPNLSTTTIVGPDGSVSSATTTSGYTRYTEDVSDGSILTIKADFGSLCEFAEHVDGRNLLPNLAGRLNWYKKYDQKNGAALPLFISHFTYFYEYTKPFCEVWLIENKDRIIGESKAFVAVKIEKNFAKLKGMAEELECDHCLVSGDPGNPLLQVVEVLLAWNSTTKIICFLDESGKFVRKPMGDPQSFQVKAGVDSSGKAHVAGIKECLANGEFNSIVEFTKENLGHLRVSSRAVKMFDPQKDYDSILKLVRAI